MFPTGTNYVLTYYRVSALYSQLYGGSNSILYGLPVPVFYRYCTCSIGLYLYWYSTSVLASFPIPVPVYYRYRILSVPYRYSNLFAHL